MFLGFEEGTLKRRKFVTVLGGVIAAWPSAAGAQRSGKIHKIGILAPTSVWQTNHQVFREELRKFGFAEGENLLIEHRPIDDPRGPSAMVAELARAGVDVFVAVGPESTLKALVGMGVTTPIVIVAVNYDPIERGYVASLARPNGNVTGILLLQPELAAKQLEFLTIAFPDRKRIGVLWDAISSDQFAIAEKAAKSMRLDLLERKLENPPYDFAMAVQALASAGAQSVLVLSSPLFVGRGRSIAQAALSHRLPTMFTFKAYVEEGGLMSYGASLNMALQQVCVYVAKILNGAKPAELPIEQSSKFSLVINLKTANALGITIPPGILSRADEIIE